MTHAEEEELELVVGIAIEPDPGGAPAFAPVDDETLAALPLGALGWYLASAHAWAALGRTEASLAFARMGLHGMASAGLAGLALGSVLEALAGPVAFGAVLFAAAVPLTVSAILLERRAQAARLEANRRNAEPSRVLEELKRRAAVPTGAVH